MPGIEVRETLDAGAEEPSTGGRTRRLARQGWQLMASPRATALLVCVLVLALQAWRSRTNVVSPYDEGYHLSYLQYVANGHLPRNGDVLNTWARETFSCHQVFPFGQTTAVPCGDLAAPSSYPEGGTNTASGWPPLYYGYGAVVVRLLGLLGVGHLEAARLASALLWAVGAGLLVLVARRYGAPAVPAVTAGLLTTVIPAAAVQAAFVTPHSAQLLISVLLCWWGLAVMTTARPPWRLAGLGAALALFSVLTVPHAVVGVMIVSGAVAGAAAFRRGRWVPAALVLGLLAAAAVGYQSWTRLVAARTVDYGDSVNTGAISQLGDNATASSVQQLLGQWFHFWPGSFYGDPLGYGPWEMFAGNAATYLAFGAIGAVVLGAGTDRRTRALAVSLLVVSPLAAWGADIYFSFPVPPRYGSSVIGIACLVAAFGIRDRVVAHVVLVAVAAAFVVDFFTIWP
jgi:hypothetical protein